MNVRQRPAPSGGTARPRTTSPRCGASTTTPSPTGTSVRLTTRRGRSPSHVASPAPAVPCRISRSSEVFEVASTTGDDPQLDSLILRLHVETACCRGGALALRPIDLDAEQCLIRLSEEGDTTRWQPVSPTLIEHLQHHVRGRSAPATGEAVRYTNGRPITHRRYDHLWGRIGRHLAWVATQQVSTHWLRHTTLTWLAFRLRRRAGVRRTQRQERRHSDVDLGAG
jgi:integrase